MLPNQGAIQGQPMGDLYDPGSRPAFGEAPAESEMLGAEVQQAGWTQAGGISLKFDIPLKGHKLEFTKVNGHPKLALKVRPENTFAFGSALIWTIFWAGMLIFLILIVTRYGDSMVLRKWGGIFLALIGLIGWLFLSDWLGNFALVCFLLGAIWLSSQRMKPTA